MSNSQNPHGTPDPAVSPSGTHGPLRDLTIAFAVGAGMAATSIMAATMSSLPTAWALPVAGVTGPAVVVAYLALRRWNRDPLEFTDERAQIINLKSKAVGFYAMAGMLAGVCAYHWLADGYTSAEPYLIILIAGNLIQAASQYSLKHKS